MAETEHQTLDFVRVLARGMADAARVPLTEFTICDTFVAPVPGVLTTLPKLPLDTDERRNGYLARLRGLPALLAAAGERHVGARAGRTAVARLVESAVAQLDLLIADPDLGGVGRADVEDDHFRQSAAETIDHDVRPALAGYRDALRTDILPLARDDDHPGICFLPEGENMYRAMARLHTSTTYTPDELHAMGREIIDQVRDELVETGSGCGRRAIRRKSSATSATTPSCATAVGRRCSSMRGESLPLRRRRRRTGSPPFPTNRARSSRCPRPKRRAWRPRTTCPVRSTAPARGPTT